PVAAAGIEMNPGSAFAVAQQRDYVAVDADRLIPMLVDRRHIGSTGGIARAGIAAVDKFGDGMVWIDRRRQTAGFGAQPKGASRPDEVLVIRRGTYFEVFVGQ